MTPDWVLTLIFWVHMLATVTWIGGLAALLLFVLPLASRTLPPDAQITLLEGIQRRFDPVAWLSLLLLVGTGMFQMSANPNYEGLLAISNRWAAAMLIKHLLFLVMVGVNATLTLGVLPGLKRVALKRLKGLDAPESDQLHRRELAILRLNFALGLLILAMTALARVS